MIEERTLKTIGDLIEFSTQNMIGKYPIMNFTFRGHKRADYKLISSLQRCCSFEKEYIENRTLTNFRKYGESFSPQLNESIWKNMIIAQHHGLPTRLLDFSISPLVALYFALDDIHSNDTAAIWAISHVKLNQLLPQDYKDILNKRMGRSFTVEALNEMRISISDYNRDMGNSSLLFIEPPSIDQRIINQFSHFALVPDCIDPLDDFLDKIKIPNVAYKFLILPQNKIIFKRQLDTLNITERTLFPGLDGIASYLSRRYKENY